MFHSSNFTFGPIFNLFLQHKTQRAVTGTSNLHNDMQRTNQHFYSEPAALIIILYLFFLKRDILHKTTIISKVRGPFFETEFKTLRLRTLRL